MRTFFYTNKSTCAEWLTRNRMAIVVVSLHAGLASSAIRHGYCLLQDLLDAGNVKVTYILYINDKHFCIYIYVYSMHTFK